MDLAIETSTTAWPWARSYRASPSGAAIADRHYNRQSIGAAQFVPPGRCLVLESEFDGPALWVTSWPEAEYVQHAWPGAWICSVFRNEGPMLSSVLIRLAVAATRDRWPDIPDLGMVTFVDAEKTQRRRSRKSPPGKCFLEAGFHNVGLTKGGLVALQLLPDEMPDAMPPVRTQIEFLW